MQNYIQNTSVPDWNSGLGAPTEFLADSLASKKTLSTDLSANGPWYPFPPLVHGGLIPSQNFLQRYPVQNWIGFPPMNPMLIGNNSTDMWHYGTEESKYMNHHFYWHMYHYFQHPMQSMMLSAMTPSEQAYSRRMIKQSENNITSSIATTFNTAQKDNCTDLMAPPTMAANSISNMMMHPHKNVHQFLCILCGDASHRHIACHLFDEKSIYFQSAMNSRVYAMHRESWKDGPTLRDVYFFIYTAMDLEPDHILLRVGSGEPVHVENYSPEVRCSDIQMFSGSIVDVLPRLGDITPVSRQAAQSALAPMIVAHNSSFVSCQQEKTDPTLSLISNHSNTIKITQDILGQVSYSEKREHEELHTVPAVAMNVTSIPSVSTSLIHLRHPLDVGSKDASRVSTVLSTSDVWTNEVSYEDGSYRTGRTASWDTAQSTEKEEQSSGNFLQSFGDTSQDTYTALYSRPANIPKRLNGTEEQVLTERPVSCPVHPQVQEVHSPPSAACVPSSKEEAEKVTNCYVESSMTSEQGEVVDAELCDTVKETESVEEKLYDKAEEEEEEERRLRTVHIKFLPVTMPFSEIRTLLWACGEVHRVRLIKPKETTNPERMFYMCFVEFASVEGLIKAMDLHGFCIGRLFRLSVDRSQQPIRGGYVTDSDAATGKPCTFGLSGAERRKIEERYFSAATIAATTPPFVIAPSANDPADPAACPPLSAAERQGAAPEGDPRRRRRRRHRHRHAGRDAREAEAEAEAVDDGAAAAGTGSYRLCIVQTLGTEQRRANPRAEGAPARAEGARDRSQSPALIGTSAATATREVETAPPTKVPFLGNSVPQSAMGKQGAAWNPQGDDTAPHDPVDVTFLRDQLRCVTTAHIRGQTHLTFFAAVSVMEDLKWASPLASFRLAIARCEAALYLFRARPGDAESAVRAAADAVRLGGELSAQMAAAVAERSGARSREANDAAWSTHFTTVPLGMQRTAGGGGMENLEKVKKTKKRKCAYFPCGDAVLHFAQVLFHTALLFDDFLLRHGNNMAATAACSDPATIARTVDVLTGAQRDLLSCARRLLMQLLAEIEAEKDANTSSALIQWRHRITLVLPYLPCGDGLLPGHMMRTVAPGIVDLCAVTLATCSDIAFL